MSHLERHDSRVVLAVVLSCTALSAGCDRAVEELKQKAMGAATKAVSDKVNEVVVEKVVQASLEKDGMKNVQADLGKNGNKVSLTDKDGKAMSFASGNAIKFTEADFGVPFYPGAKIDETKSIRIVSGDAYQYSVSLDSGEKFDKVSAFYRDKLRAASGKGKYNEMAEGTSNVKFLLVDESNAGYLMVAVEAPEDENATVTLAKQGKAAPAVKEASAADKEALPAAK